MTKIINKLEQMLDEVNALNENASNACEVVEKVEDIAQEAHRLYISHFLNLSDEESDEALFLDKEIQYVADEVNFNAHQLELYKELVEEQVRYIKAGGEEFKNWKEYSAEDCLTADYIKYFSRLFDGTFGHVGVVERATLQFIEDVKFAGGF